MRSNRPLSVCAELVCQSNWHCLIISVQSIQCDTVILLGWPRLGKLEESPETRNCVLACKGPTH